MPVRRQHQHAGRRERVRVRGRSPRAVSAELRAAAEDDDELRCTADGGPDAEDREDGSDASGPRSP
jgi:hypothetical protein